jgi:hypothetical protein
MTSDVLTPIAIAIFFILVWLFNCLNIMQEYERAVVFRLGRVLKKEKGPGLVLILWPIDKIVKVSLRVVTWDVPPQDIITRDNVAEGERRRLFPRRERHQGDHRGREFPLRRGAGGTDGIAHRAR